MVLALAFALASTLAATPCNAPEPVSPAEIASATGSLPRANDSFIVARVAPEDAPPGLRLFVREQGRWLAYDALQYTGELVADKKARDGRHMVWGWLTSEGPGQSFDGVIYRPGAAPICTTVNFSSVTNRHEATGESDWQMEYLSLDDVNIDARGRGVLVASGDLDVNGKARHVVYEFRTHDGGRTWSSPMRIKKSYRPAGIYH